MSDGRHAEFLQVVPRQVGEDLAVDLLVTERRLVLAEPKAPQPVSHVRGRISHWLRADDDQTGHTVQDPPSLALTLGRPL